MSAISQFVPLSVLRRLLAQHPVDPRYEKRARRRLIFSALVEPLRLWERVRWGRRVRATRIDPSPLFLLGFGRSGTTHLHYLFWQDPQFGVLSNYQASMHPIALTGNGWLQRLFAGQIPSKRPMDNVAISLDAPQEEEIALVNASFCAPLHFMSFPQALPEIYDRTVCDLGTDAAQLAEWKSAYTEVLQKATILSGGRRLVLKTPTNTGRIPVLLEMFPDARFVNIVRNPYSVHQSMRNMYRKILPHQVLQEFEWDDIDDWMTDAYRTIMSKYIADRKQIPSGQLIEIKYEDLEERPLEILEEIYRELGLGEFEERRPRFEAYLQGLGTYEKNRFDFPSEIVERVNQHWGFAFDAFGYAQLDSPRNTKVG